MRSVLEELRAVLTPGEKRGFAWLVLGMIALSLSEAFSIGILIPIMGLVAQPERIAPLAARLAWLGLPEDPASLLASLIAGAVAVFWAKSVYAVLMLRQQHSMVGRVRVRLKGEVFGRYLSRPYAFHLANHSAVLFKNVTQEVAQFAVGFLGSCVQLAAEGCIVLAILGLLLAAYPAVTACLTAGLGLLLAGMHFALRSGLRRGSEDRELYSGRKHKTGLEGLSAVKEIKVYRAEDTFQSRFSEAVRAYSESYVSFNVLTFIPRYVLEAVVFTGVMLGLLLALRSGATLVGLLPMLSAFALAALRLLPSVNKLQQAFSTAQYYRSSLALVHTILTGRDCPELAAPPSPAPEFPAGPQELRLAGVRFAFPGRPPLFEGLELRVAPRSTVAVVGESGAGKSTLTDLLMGLLEPEAGEARYGSVRIGRGNVEAFWRRLGYVPQQIALLDDTIRANIVFGDRVDASRLDRAVEAAQLASLVAELPEGLDTRIGERGVRLSGGQRQRVGIARALYREPEVLVLDEATSALDSHTEAQIGQAVRALRGRLTVVIIAHRLTTVESADVLYVLEKGRVVAQGSYEELLERSPVFQRLSRALAPKS